MHLNTELLTDYWRAQRPAFGSPARSSIDPTHFLDLLPQVMILGRAAAGRYGFRLAGGLVADLHGGPLQGDDFLSLWISSDRPSMQSAMEGAARRGSALVIQAAAKTAGGSAAQLEILLAPLTGADGSVDRFLGLYQPLGFPAGLPDRPIHPLCARRIDIVGDARRDEPLTEAPRLRLAALDGRRIA